LRTFQIELFCGQYSHSLTNKTATQHSFLILMNYNVLLYKHENIGRNYDTHYPYEFFILRGDCILKAVYCILKAVYCILKAVKIQIY